MRRAIERRSFCTLATSSASCEPHVVGVLYAAVEGALYIATAEGSKKLRNIRENPRVAICIPVRRFPLAPPFAVQFQATAELLSPEDRDLDRLLRARRLKKIVARGIVDDPRTRFLRVTPHDRIWTYGIGVPIRSLLRDPVSGARTVKL